MLITETQRLRIRHLDEGDAQFIVELLNEAAFIRNIADKGVQTIEDATDYLNSGPIDSYKQFGYGLNLLELKSTMQPVGMCGILKREEQDFPELGYALLTEHCSNGYAVEASRAVLINAHQVHNLVKVLAVTRPDNVRSLKLLEKLGFKFVKTVQCYNGKTENNLLEYKFQSWRILCRNVGTYLEKFDIVADSIQAKHEICPRGDDGFLGGVDPDLPAPELVKRSHQFSTDMEDQGLVDAVVEVLKGKGVNAWKNTVGHIAMRPTDLKAFS